MKEKRRDRPSIQWLTPQMLPQPGLDQVKARSQELHQGFPYWLQGPKCFNHHLLSPRVYIPWELGQRQRAELIPRHSDMECGFLKRHLNHCTIYLPQHVLGVYPCYSTFQYSVPLKHLLVCHCMDILHLVHLCTIKEHLGCVAFLSIMNNAAITIYVPMFV